MDKNNSIKLYPFLSRSKNLMEYFFIIGIEERLLEERQIPEMSLISSISSDLSLKNIDINQIIKRIYPTKPKSIDLKSNEKKTESVIFSDCFNSEKGDKKIFYSCYALKFYEKYGEFYIPKAFAIISEYPYFTTFHKICLFLYEKVIEENKYKEDGDKIPIDIYLYCLVNFSPSPINNNINLKVFPNNEIIKIPKLTAYPFIDFDLFSILNIVSINELIKIYILVFLEIPLLFFFNNIEKLNLFIYALYILNYPLTNTTYFWYIYSISDQDLKKGFHHAGPTLRGVNKNYSSDLDCTNFIGLEYIVDLKNKKLVLIKDNKNENEIKTLLDIIKKKGEKSFLIDAINSLEIKLKKIENNYNIIKREKNLTSSFYMDDKIMDLNKLIQEAFYDFNINILVELYKEYQLNDSCSSIVKCKNKINESSEGGNIIIKYLKYTDKCNIYFNNYVKNFESIDEYRMSLFIFDDLVNKKIIDLKKQSQKMSEIRYCEIIDGFYSTKKTMEIFTDTISKEDKDNIRNIEYNKGKKKSKKRILFYLDKKKIDTFLFYLKNDPKFDSLRKKEAFTINIQSIEKGDALIKIKNSLSKLIFSQEFYLEISIIYIFSLVFPFLSFNKCKKYLQIILKNVDNNYCRRDCLLILVKSIYKYYLLNQKSKFILGLDFDVISKYYEEIKKHLINNKIIPNKELFLILKNILNEKRENINEKDNNKNKGQNNFIFICNEDENIIINYNFVTLENHKCKLNNKEYPVFSSDQIYIEIFSLHKNYFSEDFNIQKLQIRTLEEVIVNSLSYYQSRNNEISLFLYESIFALNNLKDQLGKFIKKK